MGAAAAGGIIVEGLLSSQELGRPVEVETSDMVGAHDIKSLASPPECAGSLQSSATRNRSRHPAREGDAAVRRAPRFIEKRTRGNAVRDRRITVTVMLPDAVGFKPDVRGWRRTRAARAGSASSPAAGGRVERKAIHLASGRENRGARVGVPYPAARAVFAIALDQPQTIWPILIGDWIAPDTNVRQGFP